MARSGNLRLGEVDGAIVNWMMRLAAVRLSIIEKGAVYVTLPVRVVVVGQLFDVTGTQSTNTGGDTLGRIAMPLGYQTGKSLQEESAVNQNGYAALVHRAPSVERLSDVRKSDKKKPQ